MSRCETPQCSALRECTTSKTAPIYNRFMLSWIEIDASRLKANIDALRGVTAPGTSVMAVVKANAYGHGLETIAPIVAERADWLGVNCIDEALAITKLGIEKPVAIL